MPAVSDTFRLYLLLSFASTSLVLSALMLHLLWRKPRSVSKPQKFPQRELLSADQFYQQYYASKRVPRAVVLDALAGFASAARVHAGLIRPEDSFATLGAYGDDCDHFAAAAETALKEAESRYGTSLFQGKLITLDDYIRAASLAERLIARSAVAR